MDKSQDSAEDYEDVLLDDAVDFEFIDADQIKLEKFSGRSEGTGPVTKGDRCHYVDLLNMAEICGSGVTFRSFS